MVWAVVTVISMIAIDLVGAVLIMLAKDAKGGTS